MCITIAKVKKSCGDGLNDEADNFPSHSHVRGDLNGNLHPFTSKVLVHFSKNCEEVNTLEALVKVLA